MTTWTLVLLVWFVDLKGPAVVESTHWTSKAYCETAGEEWMKNYEGFYHWNTYVCKPS